MKNHIYLDNLLFPAVKINNKKIIEYNKKFISEILNTKGVNLINTDISQIIYEKDKNDFIKFLKTNKLKINCNLKTDKFIKLFEIQKIFYDNKTKEYILIFNNTNYPPDNNKKMVANYTIPIQTDKDKLKGFIDLFDELGIGVIIFQDTKNKKRVIKKTNRTIIKFLKYHKRELFNKKQLEDILDEKYIESGKKAYNNILEGSEIKKSYKLVVKNRDGERYKLKANIEKIDYMGKPAIIGFIMDITEISKTAQKLKEKETQLDFVVNSLDSFIWQAYLTENNEYRHSIMSKGLKKISGYKPEELISKTIEWDDFVYPEDLPIIQKMRKIALSGQKVDSEYRIISKSGKIKWVRDMAIPYKEKGKLKYLNGYCIDITKEKEREIELRKIKTAIEAADEIIIITDNKGIIQYINPAFTKISGYTYNDVIGKDIRLFRGGNLSREYYDKLWETVLSGKRWQGKLIKKRKDGSTHIVSASIVPIKNKKKEITNILTIHKDITKEEELNELFKEIVKALGEIGLSFVIIQDKNGKMGVITYANELFIKTTGYKKKEIINRKSFFDFIKDELKNNFRKKYIQSKKIKNLSLTFKTLFSTKKGDLSVEVTTTKLEYLNEPAYFVIIKDITKEEIYEENMRQAQKYEALGNLTAGIAHDFNNILGGILGYIALLKKDVKGNKTAEDKITTIEKAGSKAAELIKQLLGFSRRGKYEAKLLDINKSILNMLKILERTLPKNIEIKKSLKKNLNSIYADPSQVDQIIMNLLINSSQAMKNGGIIYIKTREQIIDSDFVKQHPYAKRGRYLIITIKDTGIGMSKETLKHVFEPFFTTKKPGEGTGLGLSTVYGIVKNHNGFILINSILNKGTEIKVYLPSTGKKIFEKNDKEKKTDIFDKNIGKKILVIDDEKIIRNMLKDFLSEHNYNIVCAENGFIGVKMYRKTKPDLTILDMRMPVMEGRETFKIIREINPNAKIIIITGYSFDNDVNAILKKKDVSFIKKPFKLDQILKLVEYLI
jgi:PAS domain S-box-containing protein